MKPIIGIVNSLIIILFIVHISFVNSNATISPMRWSSCSEGRCAPCLMKFQPDSVDIVTLKFGFQIDIPFSNISEAVKKLDYSNNLPDEEQIFATFGYCFRHLSNKMYLPVNGIFYPLSYRYYLFIKLF